jgi:hypothetical protein
MMHADCRYTECHYADCHYTERRGAEKKLYNMDNCVSHLDQNCRI